MKGTSSDLPPAAGKSSFELIEPEKLFAQLRLTEGATFLDVACGRGFYTLAAREIIGEKGSLYAVDLWQEGISWLIQEAAARGIENIHAMVADVGSEIPVPTQRVDTCLVATVLHDLVEEHKEERALEEIARVLKSGGELGILEFKKIVGPPGPPLEIRLAANEVEQIVIPHGFVPSEVDDSRAYVYLMTFKRR